MLIYTLHFMLTSAHLLTPVELLGIIVSLYLMLYLTTPAPEQRIPNPHYDSTSEGLVEILFTAWQGELQLWKVFWPFFIILNGVLLSADTLATRGLFSVSSWDNVLLMAASSSIIWLVSVWRCSALTSSTSWAALARLLTLAAFIDFGLRIFIRIDYPRDFFDCQELLLNYSSCF